MFRYVVAYTTNNFHTTNYDTVFAELKDSCVFLRSATWHLSAKCKDSNFAVKSITLQHKVGGKWCDFEGDLV